MGLLERVGMRKVSSGDDMAAMGMLRTRGHVGFPKHGGGAKIIQNWSFVGGQNLYETVRMGSYGHGPK